MSKGHTIFKFLKLLMIFLFFWVCIYTNLINADTPRGLIREGLDFYDKENYANALKSWKLASEVGSREADFLLGFLYDGVLQNDKQALFFLQPPIWSYSGTN